LQSVDKYCATLTPTPPILQGNNGTVDSDSEFKLQLGLGLFKGEQGCEPTVPLLLCMKWTSAPSSNLHNRALQPLHSLGAPVQVLEGKETDCSQCTRRKEQRAVQTQNPTGQREQPGRRKPFATRTNWSLPQNRAQLEARWLAYKRTLSLCLQVGICCLRSSLLRFDVSLLII
jgi:hypothetical protein